MSETPPPLPPAPPRPAGGTGTAVAVGIGGAVVVLVLALLGGALLLRSTLQSPDLQDALGTEVVPPPGDDYEMPPEPVRPAPSPVTAGPCTYLPTDDPPARPVTPPDSGDVAASGAFVVTLETSAGRIGFRADAARTPCSLASLRNLAEQGYFDGTSCHRLTTDGIWVLQCGDPTGTGTGGPGYRFADEALQGAVYPRGTVAMANAGPATNGSQFFLVYRDTKIPPHYTPLGEITEGLEAIEAIAAAGADGENGAGDGRPRTPVTITRLRVAPA